MKLIKEVKNELLNEKYYEINHASGLKIYVMPKPSYSTSYAVFGTNFGSECNIFKDSSGSAVHLPDGTAHFLEHKLFESEELDAFEKFSQTGASANAYTSFDRTCYLFTCSENFYKNLETLLDFVQHPYFTAETVAKEQGIIGQEIKMYDDTPSWQATMGLLQCLYKNIAVNTDIAGTVESIAEITPEHLYAAYNAFYNPSNMVLGIAGNVDVNRVNEICKKCLPAEKKPCGEKICPAEPVQVVSVKKVKKMDVSLPLFAFGYKESGGRKTLEEQLGTVVLNEILIGGMSPLYQKLLDGGLVNENFYSEYFTGDGYASVIFTGESRNPEKVKSELEKEVERLRRDGIDNETFNCVLKQLYGEHIMSYNNIDDVATGFTEAYFKGCDIFDEIKFYQNVKKEDIEKLLKSKFNANSSAMSVVMPLK